jgi:hypothetical protein
MLVQQMFDWGRRMFAEAGKPELLPTLDKNEFKSVLRVKNSEEADQIDMAARATKKRQLVSRLSTHQAEHLLRGFFDGDEGDSVYYAIPDAPFHEAAIVEGLRARALRGGAKLCDLSQPARLVPESGGSFHVDIEGRECHPTVTVACAGAGNFELLGQLDVRPRFTLRQTPLLVARDNGLTDLGVYADRVRGFSFVRHPIGESADASVLVVGTGIHCDDMAFCSPDMRRVTGPDVEQFRSRLPPSLVDSAGGRFTAGWEVIPDESTGRKEVQHWIEPVEGYSTLLQVHPGRATLGWFAASQALTAVKRAFRAQRGRRFLSVPDSGAGRDTFWDGNVHMHFEPHYSFDDSREA